MIHLTTWCHNRSAVSSQFLRFGASPGLFFLLYHSSEPCFLLSLALEELLMFTVNVCRTRKSDAQCGWTVSPTWALTTYM